MGRAVHHGPQRGFTLLELIIALALLGFLMLLLNGGLSFGARAMDRLGSASAAAQSRTAGLEALRMLLEHVQPVRLTGEGGVHRVSFDGGKDGVRFLADLGPASPVPGLRSYRLMADDAQGRIVLEDGRSRTEIMEGIRRFRLSFFDGAGWRDDWPDQGDLPALIRLDIEYEGEGRDKIIVAPRATVGASRRAGG